MIESYEIILSLLLLFIFAYWPYQWFVLDLFRQRLFVIRDKGFIHAVEQNTLETPDYRAFRKRINDMVRYAHCIAWWRMVLVSVILQNKNSTSSLEKFSDKYFDAEYEKAMHIAMFLTVARSPILMLIAMVFTPIFILVVLFGVKPVRSMLRLIKRSENAVFKDIEFSNKAHC